MAPIRVGLVGLAGFKSDGLGAHTWAVVAILPTLFNSPDYELVAVCNSSVESSRRAIEFHNLPASVKAYGNPKDLADDPDVDMVFVSVLVTKHFMLAEPALLKKKKVFVEWPLGASTQEAEKLAELARESDLGTIVGLQGRGGSVVKKAKEIIDSGKLGRITSSSVLASTCFVPPMFPPGTEYYMSMQTGGNAFHIGLGHFLDSFTHVLGGFDPDTVQSILKREQSEALLMTAEGGTKAIPKNVPDHWLIQGILESGAVASIAFRWAKYQNAVDDVGVRWIITGTEGELEIVTPQHQWQIDGPGRKLLLKLNDKEAEEVAFSEDSASAWREQVPAIGANTAAILDSFAQGSKGEYADFDSAVKNHKLLDLLVEKSGYKY
ncbi:oxidoreductase [Stachybotrys elegans]|uniref:Oxidoreductase n=1 Tax=Stachybotrys elegans TaxID=80388 RepID=A0A8K0SL24_9HYPO|nr:oxidoreductase [Stachybotrys elegans]